METNSSFLKDNFLNDAFSHLPDLQNNLLQSIQYKYVSHHSAWNYVFVISAEF